ncbi:MAG: sigma-70 family RNA polymerase sigma factor [Planctomycetes bacterium]|nr:sigma-70 family RNA polymerase sigma factor [Planctomycetota bacterium]
MSNQDSSVVEDEGAEESSSQSESQDEGVIGSDHGLEDSEVEIESIPEITQADLVIAAQAGDLAAWKKLIAIHAPRLAAYIGARLRRPEIVDRLVADSIYVAWKHIAELEDENEFPAWFRRMGGSVTMRWYKRHNDEGISGEFPIERCDNQSLGLEIEELDNALGRLPEKERMALEQRYRAGLQNAEIAEVLHKDPEQVEKLIQSGLRHLQKSRQK